MYKCHFCKRVITSTHYYWDDFTKAAYNPDGIPVVNRNSICIECLRAKGYGTS